MQHGIPINNTLLSHSHARFVRHCSRHAPTLTHARSCLMSHAPHPALSLAVAPLVARSSAFFFLFVPSPPPSLNRAHWRNSRISLPLPGLSPSGLRASASGPPPALGTRTCSPTSACRACSLPPSASLHRPAISILDLGCVPLGSADPIVFFFGSSALASYLGPLLLPRRIVFVNTPYYHLNIHIRSIVLRSASACSLPCCVFIVRLAPYIYTYIHPTHILFSLSPSSPDPPTD